MGKTVREKLRLSDLNVLFICLDIKYSVSSARVIADVVTFRNLGGNPLLICFEGSALDKAADAQDIKRHYLNSKKFWSQGLELFQYVNSLRREQRVDFVHCYDYQLLLILGFILKRDVRIPLLYTCNESLAEFYRPFWHDYFVTRVDQVIAFSPVLVDQIKEILPLGKRRVTLSGVGVELANTVTISLKKDPFKICCYIAPDASDTDVLVPMLINLPLLEIQGTKVILSLTTKGSWYQHPAYEKFKRLILERGLEHYVSFHSKPWGGGCLTEHQAYVSLSGELPFDEFDLVALLHKIPVILPRTAARSHLIKHGEFGLTYKVSDVRELREKILQLIENYDLFTDRIERAWDELVESHQYDVYVSDLFQLYERLSLQRLRFSLKKQRRFASKN